MKILTLFTKAVKHIGTIRKVSDTLLLLINHLEEVVPKLRDIWADDLKKLEVKD